LSVDKCYRWGRFAQSEPFNDQFEFGLQAMQLSAVTTLATGQSGKTIASVLGEPPLYRPQRNAMMAGYLGQRHLMFDTGL
jgi:hypothetical protein